MRHLWSVPLCFVLVGMALPVVAQDTPAVELSGGYQNLDQKEEDSISIFGHGWYADAAYNLTKVVGVVGEVAGGYNNFQGVFSNGSTTNITVDTGLHEFMAGARLSDRRASRVVWFGQILVGGVRAAVNITETARGGIPIIPKTFSESLSYFGLQLGGGVNVGITKTIGVRLGADSLRIFHEGEGVSVFRFASGVVLSLARK